MPSSTSTKRRSKRKFRSKESAWPAADPGMLRWGAAFVVLCVAAFQTKGWFSRTAPGVEPRDFQLNFGHSEHHTKEPLWFWGSDEPPLITDAPYAAAILVSSGVKYDLLCTGTLVSQDWVLTSAGCVKSRDTSSLLVVIGANDLEKLDKAVVSSVKKNVLHKNIKGDVIPAEFDLALLHLNNKDTTHTPINLDGGKCPPLTESTDLKVVGWGHPSKKSGIHPRLREVKPVTFITPSKCKGKLPYDLQAKEPMCTSRSKMSKKGDYKYQVEKGSPLVTSSRQVGVVSESFSTTNGEFPVLYAKVSSSKDWIQEQNTGARFTCGDGRSILSQLGDLFRVVVVQVIAPLAGLIVGAAIFWVWKFPPRNRLNPRR